MKRSMGVVWTAVVFGGGLLGFGVEVASAGLFSGGCISGYPRGYVFRQPDYAPLMDVGRREYREVTPMGGGKVRLGVDPLKFVRHPDRGAVILNEVVTNITLGGGVAGSVGEESAERAGLSDAQIRDLAVLGRVGGRVIGRDGEEDAAAEDAVPFGRWVEGRPGFVFSPFAESHQLVDVGGIAPGEEVRCPYTGKRFRIPAVAVEVKEAEESDDAGASESGESSGEAAEPKDSDAAEGDRSADRKGVSSSSSAIGPRDS